MKTIGLIDRVKNREVLHGVMKSSILHTIKTRKANWICHALRTKCLLRHVIEGKIEGRIEVTGRRGRRCKKLLDYIKERRGSWTL